MNAIYDYKTLISMTIVTKEDLEQFRIQLLEDIRQIIISNETKPIKPWLKNDEVKELLGISTNTLQRLRVSGRLRFSKVGGIHYYKYADIEKLLNDKAA
jgi:hypothetical protein